jgi:hypothetical protein
MGLEFFPAKKYDVDDFPAPRDAMKPTATDSSTSARTRGRISRVRAGEEFSLASVFSTSNDHVSLTFHYFEPEQSTRARSPLAC